jgi:uncharacterized protein YjiK
MKKILLVVLMCTFFLQKSYAQGAEILWEKNMDSTVKHFAKTFNGGGAFVTVNFEDNDYDNYDSSNSNLVFMDSQGKILKKTYLGKEMKEGIREASKIIGHTDGYIIFGMDENQYSDIEQKDNRGVWMMNTDCNGKEISSKIIWPGVKGNELSSLSEKERVDIKYILPVEEGYLLHLNVYYRVGYLSHFILDKSIILKIDKSGQLMWETELNPIKNLTMKETQNNEYIIIGIAYDGNFRTDTEIDYLKLNKNGNILIKKKIVDPKKNSLSIPNKNKKNLFSYRNDKYKLVVVELDDEGKIIFETTYDKISDPVNKIIETDDNCYLILIKVISREMVLIKMNKKGDIIWQQEVDRLWEGLSYSIEDLGNNEYLLYGHRHNAIGRVIKLKENQTSLGIEDQNIKNDSIYLYPNPVDTYLFIKIPNNQKVKKIVITDITGRLLMERKEFQDKIDMSMYEPGIYIITIETDSDTYIQKVLKR